MNLFFPQNIALSYVLYITYRKDEIVYIGSGKRGREFHTISGASNNRSLNKSYFNDEPLTTHIIGESDDVLILQALEKLLINHLQPVFNTTYKQMSLSDIESTWEVLRKGRLGFLKSYLEKAHTRIGNLLPALEGDCYKDEIKVHEILSAEHEFDGRAYQGLTINPHYYSEFIDRFPIIGEVFKKNRNLYSTAQQQEDVEVFLYIKSFASIYLRSGINRKGLEPGILDAIIHNKEALTRCYFFPSVRFTPNEEVGPLTLSYLENNRD